MPSFNLTVPFTQEWKNAILESIAQRRIDPYPSKFGCAACDLNMKLSGKSTLECTTCVIGETPKSRVEEIYGWCGTYSIEMCPSGEFHMDTEKRLAYLDKMENAVRRRKVVK